MSNPASNTLHHATESSAAPPKQHTPHALPILVVAGLCGILFALGLVLSGMTQPAKVLGFLNVKAMLDGAFPGQWDASLGFVMGGAVLVTLLGFGFTLRRGTRPWLAASFSLPTRKDIDTRLLLGAVLFGIGWGLVGYCPGPVLASLIRGGSDVWYFAVPMVVGMVLAYQFRRKD